jgi:diaminohydroxyphosphoribosylaminopyrimidine deaminase/5-amino-6-(5-phosphoribosylamino)uracil reductase
MTDPSTPASFASPAEAMWRAIELAGRGLGHVEPNPPVGAIVLDTGGRCVGEGWHQKYGGPHAEVHALQQAGGQAWGGTLFVTLEPCCHQGKTPPCTDAVITSGVKRVFIAVRDPAPWVNGKGIDRLREADIEVIVGLEEASALELLEPFIKLVTHGLPWVHAKWAMTLDGKIATREGDSQWISNPECRALVHELRGRMDAIIVGIGTAIHDDPLLTARPSGPRQALRVVLDTHALLPMTSKLVTSAREVPVLVCVSSAAPADRREALASAGVEVLTVDASDRPPMPEEASPHISLRRVLEDLGRRKLTHVLIEGGSEVLGSAFDEELVDEVHAFIAPLIIGGDEAVTPVGGLGLERIEMSRPLRQLQIREVAGNVYMHGRTQR